MTPWVKSLTAVNGGGLITQLYPTFCTAGAGLGTQGESVRRPMEGTIDELLISGDGTNAAIIEFWDASGADHADVDVDTGETMTEAQLNTLIAAGKARLIKKVAIAGTDQLTVIESDTGGTPIMRGLCARAVPAGGAKIPPAAVIKINVNATGLFQKYDRHV